MGFWKGVLKVLKAIAGVVLSLLFAIITLPVVVIYYLLSLPIEAAIIAWEGGE